MKKMTVVLLSLVSFSGFSAKNSAVFEGSSKVQAQSQRYVSVQLPIVAASVNTAVRAAVTTVGAVTVAGTAVSNLG